MNGKESYPILTYFAFEHLPPSLRKVSEPFGLIAHDLAKTLPPSDETSACLRKLLEAKDCAVRAALPPRRSHIQHDEAGA